MWRVTGYPYIWSIILGLSLRLFLEDIKMRMGMMNYCTALTQSWQASSNQLKARKEQRPPADSWVGILVSSCLQIPAHGISSSDSPGHRLSDWHHWFSPMCAERTPLALLISSFLVADPETPLSLQNYTSLINLFSHICAPLVLFLWRTLTKAFFKNYLKSNAIANQRWLSS